MGWVLFLGAFLEGYVFIAVPLFLAWWVLVRVVEIHVERLKSYGDYSNRSVRLVARLDEGEDVREAYMRLAREAETLLEIQKISADKELVEAEMRSYEERVRELKAIREEFEEVRGSLVRELESLRGELEKIERLAEEKQLKLSEKIIEKIRAIRRAIYGYGLSYDP